MQIARAGFGAILDAVVTGRGNSAESVRPPQAAWSALRSRERRHVLRTLAGLLRHDMATPFNVIVGRAAMIASGSLTREAAIDNARTIQEQAEKAVLLLDRLAGVGVVEPEVASECDVRDVLRETERWLGTFAPEIEPQVVVEVPEGARWVGDEHASLLALASLCEVAAETCTAPRALRVHARRDPAVEGDGVAPRPAFAVVLEWPSDRGREVADAAALEVLPGIPHRADVHVPVAVARKLARLHGGELVVDLSTPGTVRCELRWPLAGAC